MRGKVKRSGHRLKVPVVLVVGEDEHTRGGTVSYLRYAGFIVQVVPEGESAIEHAKALEPGVVLVDLSVGDSIEFVRSLKAKAVRSIVIAMGDEGHAQVAHEAGCDALVPRPCPPQRLVATVMRAFGTARRQASEA